MIGKLLKIGRKETSDKFSDIDPQALFESEQAVVREPFFFPGDNGEAVLLIHGWTAVPYELRRFGRYLNENGYTVSGPVLSGHATRPEDLEGVSWEDWFLDVSEAYDELKKEHDRVHVMGTSIGAVLCSLLAGERPDVASATFMAMPYRLRLERLIGPLLKAIRPFKKYGCKVYPKKLGFQENITRKTAYRTYPIESVLEVFELVRTARRNLPKVIQPCFVLQSETDSIVNRRSVDEIFAGIGSEFKKKKLIGKAYHTFISDIRNEHVFEEILDFIRTAG